MGVEPVVNRGPQLLELALGKGGEKACQGLFIHASP